MLKVSLRSDLRRGEFFCLSVLQELCRFFGSPPALSVCFNADLFPSLQLFFYQKDTQADANNHRHSLLDNNPFFSVRVRSKLAGFPFSEGLSRPSLQGRSRILSFSFGFFPLLRIVFHSTHVSSRALTLCCPLHTISIVFSLTLVPPSFFSRLQSFDSHFCTVRLQLF